MATVAKPPVMSAPGGTPPMVPRVAPREELNPFRIAQIQFDMAAEVLKLDQGLRQVLRTPKRILEVSLPTKMDNGQLKVLTGFRVQHNVSRGAGQGRNPLSSQCDAGRSEGTGRLDDLEDGGGECTVWWRKGRRDL